MTGILVFGSNHLLLEGPLPSETQALALARFHSVVEIGGSTPAALLAWTIVTKAFRENLEWAWVAPGEDGHTDAVRILLDEMRARGVEVRTAGA